jgi:hypothetical protein
MARWVLGCPLCKKDFTHSQIPEGSRAWLGDPFAWLGDKPVFPNEGLPLVCPNCQKPSVYKRTELVYRAI